MGRAYLRIHESSRGKQYPTNVDLYTDEGGQPSGEAWMMVHIDFFADILPDVYQRLKNGKDTIVNITLVEK